MIDIIYVDIDCDDNEDEHGMVANAKPKFFSLLNCKQYLKMTLFILFFMQKSWK